MRMANTIASCLPSAPDKDSKMFRQSLNDPCSDLFDQFLDLDSLDTDSSTGLFNMPCSTPLLVRPRSIGPIGINTDSTSTGTVRDEHARHHLRASTAEELGLGSSYKQNPTSAAIDTALLYHEKSGKAAISDSELLSLEGIHLFAHSPALSLPTSSPHTPSLQVTSAFPLTPATTGKRHRILDIPNSKHRREGGHYRRASLHHAKYHTRAPSSSHEPEGQRRGSPIRKVTSPAKMLRSHQSDHRLQYHHNQYSDQTLREWTQKLADEAKNFNFDFQTTPLSPPPSARVSNASTDSHGMMHAPEQHGVANSFQWDHPMPQYARSRQPQARTAPDVHSPMTTPRDASVGYGFPAAGPLSAPTGNGIITPSQIQNDWTHASLPNDFSFAGPEAFSEDAQHSQGEGEYKIGDETDTGPIWWGQTSAPPLVHEQSPTAPVRMSMAGPMTSPGMAAAPFALPHHSNPHHQHRRTKSQNAALALRLQNELAYNSNELSLSSGGLGLIQNLPSSPNLPNQQHFVIPTSGNEDAHLPYFNQGSHVRNQALGLGISIGAGSQQQSQGFGGESLEVRKMRGNHANGTTRVVELPEDSPSPTSGAPTNMPIRNHRDGRAVSRRNASQHRAPSTSQSQRSRSAGGRSSSRHSAGKTHGGISKSRNPSASASKSGGGGMGIDFVNFTPNDSRKILTGVAPSGSSKTKARREKEAMEKRRRLSLAAVRAVRAAGGCIDGLELDMDVELEIGNELGLSEMDETWGGGMLEE